MDSERRVALITGASRGLGAAIALRLARDGCDVALNFVADDARDNAAEAEAVAEQARKLDVEALCVEADVTDRAAVEAMVAEVGERLGPVDVLVNNAGITRDRTLRKLAPEDWDSVLAVNLTGAFNCCRAVVEGMTDRGWGRIVSVSSVVALLGNFGQTNYVATKAGVIGMTKVWAKELGRKGITVNAVAPGFIMTDMMSTVPEKILTNIREKTPLGRLGEPRDIAYAYLYLASDEAAFVNGAVLQVDGGLAL